MAKGESGKGLNRALFSLILYIVVYVAVEAFTGELFGALLPALGYQLPSTYFPYVSVLLSLAFGYLIVNGIAGVAYWSFRGHLPHSTASAARSMIRVIGLGGLVAAIAGGIAGGVAGVALGGFLGLVVGQATQSTLGQAVAGLFLLISRPFKVGDKVVLNNEEGTVDEVSTLFTTIVKDDGKRVLLPNNSVVGTKITIYPRQGN